MVWTILRRAMLVATVAIAACSGNMTDPGEGAGARTIPVKAWASKVCEATTHWIDEIGSLNAGLAQKLDASSVASLRGSTVAYLDDILSSTDRMIERVEAAGAPRVEGGPQAARHVLSGLQAAREALQDARERAADLTTGDPAAFSEALRQIGEEVSASLARVGASMASFRSPALDAAARDVRRCRELVV
jgi:hypothetical protein